MVTDNMTATEASYNRNSNNNLEQPSGVTSCAPANNLANIAVYNVCNNGGPPCSHSLARARSLPVRLVSRR